MEWISEMAYENDIPQIPQTRTRSESNPDSNSKEYYKNIYFQGVDKLIHWVINRMKKVQKMCKNHGFKFQFGQW